MAEIEAVQKRPHECPNCNYTKVKREFIGVWACRKCGLRFAGGAWNPKGTQVPIFSTAKERILEEEAEFEKVFQDKQTSDAVEDERKAKREAHVERNVAIIVNDNKEEEGVDEEAVVVEDEESRQEEPEGGDVL